MKRLFFLAFLALNVCTVFGQDLTKKQQTGVDNFINNVKNQKKETIAANTSYPFQRKYPLPAIMNKSEFLERYDEVFDGKLTKMIVNSNPAKDWASVGWRGIMLYQGDVWLSDDGKLLSVNYQSKLEAAKMNALINQEKQKLYKSVQQLEKPVQIIKTKTYLIRIDDMANGNYRYASWKLGNKMSSKPDLIVLHGKYIPDGSGGNHSFEFVNGIYKYECAILEMGEKNSSSAYLTIYKGDKKILFEKGNVVRK
ncbi:hypothetical protein ABIB40_002888 [Pedobacter sp. UYP30]|uniref:hypothetical protein n=1 Tax=Pedobacter sp. UYP30 TaxID=1756400 RepID=UPI003394AF62